MVDVIASDGQKITLDSAELDRAVRRSKKCFHCRARESRERKRSCGTKTKEFLKENWPMLLKIAIVVGVILFV